MIPRTYSCTSTQFLHHLLVLGRTPLHVQVIRKFQFDQISEHVSGNSIVVVIVFREVVVEELDNTSGEDDCNTVEIEATGNMRDDNAFYKQWITSQRRGKYVLEIRRIFNDDIKIKLMLFQMPS